MVKRLRSARQMLGGDARKYYGCTVTFATLDKSRWLTLVATNEQPTKGLRALVREALRIDPSFRVVSYSTPQTILVDISGNRGGANGRGVSVERTALSRIGMSKYLHPEAERPSVRNHRP